MKLNRYGFSPPSPRRKNTGSPSPNINWERGIRGEGWKVYNHDFQKAA
jgi:hypothetical protein